ncbi:MAG: cyclic nucleotide-binding protein, partial [Tolypothrix sp. Co-bin9]|nr:cyclic nucleotide-binding protein [Tolypothrix sp. Co-bin9]
LQLDVSFPSRFYHPLLLLLSTRLRDVGSQLGDTIFENDTYPTKNRIVAKARWDWLLRRFGGD